MKIIRPTGIIFFTVFLALIIIFNIFFLNSTVKKILINTGEQIFRAVVEISKVDIKLTKSRIEIAGIKIADKDNEFKNLFEVEKIVFDYEFIPLLKKKIIIDDIELTGFATGTKRQKSGKLSEKRIKEIEKKEKKQKQENKLFNGIVKKINDKSSGEIKKLPITKTINTAINLKDKNINDLIKKEDLESYKTIVNSKTKIENSKKDIENKLNSLNFDKRSDELKQKADSFKSVKISGVADIPSAQAKIKELDSLKNEVNSIKKEIETVKNDSEQLIKFTGNLPGEIKSAKDKDIQNIMSKMKLDILNAKDIETALIGPVWKSRIDKIFQIISLVNKYIPEGKKTKKKSYNEIVRKKGIDYIFISKQPSFWIKNIKISKSNKSDGVGISGKITDLCFEQILINKPCIAELNGKRDSKSINALIKIDRRQDINDLYQLKISGFNTDDMGFNNIDYGNIKFLNGVVSADLKANMDEQKINIDGNVNISNIKFDAQDKQDILYLIISSIDNMNIDFNAIAKESNFEFSVNSDILNKIDSGLKKLYGKKMQEARETVEKNIDNFIKNDKDGLNKTASQATGEIKNKINELSKKSQVLDGYIDGIKNELLKKITDTQKGSAGDMIKGLFK